MLPLRTASHAIKNRPLIGVPALVNVAQGLSSTQLQQRRNTSYGVGGGNDSMFGPGSGGPPNTYFRRERLPANTIIRFVFCVTAAGVLY